MIGSGLSTVVAFTLVAYTGAMIGLGWYSRGKVHDVEDYVLAGRSLPLSLAVPTLLATWFGAGTLLAATDEVRAVGMTAAALDPFGAGVCLLLAGWFLARPLWRMGLLTLPDFFGRTYGKRAETLSAVLMVPGYFGWIAAQFVALAGILDLYFGLPVHLGIALVALVGTAYTLAGGMWAVTLTDAVQMVLVALGLFVLFIVVMMELGGGVFGGVGRILTETPTDRLSPLPDLAGLLPWLGLFAAGALGNLPGQDLTQRIFAAQSADVASRACVIAGALYLTLGMLPLGMGLAADLLLPGDAGRAVLPMLAGVLLHPALAVIFVVTLISAVLSTVDSAILAPSTVLAHNLLGPRMRWMDPLRLQRAAVVAVALASMGVAYLGESAWSLLESSYELGMVSLLSPLVLGLYLPGARERAALGSMVVGTALWTAHLVLGLDALAGTPVPVGLGSAGLAALTFVILRGRPASAPAT